MLRSGDDQEVGNDDSMPELTLLEKQFMGFLAAHGIDNPADLDFVVRRVRTTMRVFQLAELLDRSLSRVERGQAYRRLHEGQSVEDVVRWLLTLPPPVAT